MIKAGKPVAIHWLLVLALSNNAVAAGASDVNWDKLWNKEKQASPAPKAPRQQAPKPPSQRRVSSMSPSSPEKASQPVPASADIVLDAENENKLAVGEKMYQAKEFNAAMDLAQQVLSKYPRCKRATSLKIRAQTEKRKLQEGV